MAKTRSIQKAAGITRAISQRFKYPGTYVLARANFDGEYMIIYANFVDRNLRENLARLHREVLTYLLSYPEVLPL